MTSNLEHTAIHEAGHAVIACVLGFPVSAVTITPSTGSRGLMLLETGPDEVCQEWEQRTREQVLRGIRDVKYRDSGTLLRGHILVCMAGLAAEDEILGSNSLDSSAADDDAWTHDDFPDLVAARRMAESSYAFATDEHWVRYEPRMWRQVRRLVRKHRDKIERVAAALLARRTLTSDEVSELIRASR